MSLIPDQLIWWITAVDIPLVTGFVLTLGRTRQQLEANITRVRDVLASYKLEVAHHYASVNSVKDLESRVIAHLLRIENKLDNTVYRTTSPKEN